METDVWHRKKDKFHISVVNIGYLMYPTLCLQAFALFNCRYVGETLYLSADLEVQCFTGYHLTMVVVFGGIQIVGFVIGMPIFLYVMLKKKTNKTSSRTLKIPQDLGFSISCTKKIDGIGRYLLLRGRSLLFSCWD